MRAALCLLAGTAVGAGVFLLVAGLRPGPRQPRPLRPPRPGSDRRAAQAAVAALVALVVLVLTG